MGMFKPESLGIDCMFCEKDAMHSLCTIIGMLKPYLSYEWQVQDITSPPVSPVLRLVNLDHPDKSAVLTALDSEMRTIGCSLHPRQHAPGTIHYRPFRSYELLSVLKEVERLHCLNTPEKDNHAAIRALEKDAARRFRLIYWPDEFEGWPHHWWPILACLRHRYLDINNLAKELNLPCQTVAECLDRLLSIHAVKVEFDMQALASSKPASGRWRKLGERLAGMLRAST